LTYYTYALEGAPALIASLKLSRRCADKIVKELTERKRGSGVTRVIERVEAHYEVQDVEMGKVYRWCPANVLVECTCGAELTLSAFSTTCCECGADHTAIVGEVLHARPEDKGDQPWRYLQPYKPTPGT
jgi:hypothetical protein